MGVGNFWVIIYQNKDGLDRVVEEAYKRLSLDRKSWVEAIRPMDFPSKEAAQQEINYMLENKDDENYEEFKTAVPVEVSPDYNLA